MLARSTHARFLAQAYRRLGELHEDAGRAKAAIQRYSDFMALWRSAGPALQPAVEAAKARMLRLQTDRGTPAR